jgi:hypothetical protein
MIYHPMIVYAILATSIQGNPTSQTNLLVIHFELSFTTASTDSAK